MTYNPMPVAIEYPLLIGHNISFASMPGIDGDSVIAHDGDSRIAKVSEATRAPAIANAVSSSKPVRT